MNVTGRIVGAAEGWELTQPGDYYFLNSYNENDAVKEKNVAISFMCPCGCGERGAITIRGPGVAERPSWSWDGNESAPTLSPSIQRNTPCRWHGHLIKGVWEQC